MKKAILVLLIMISIIKAQNQPGVNYMPHISFFDFAVNYLHNPNEDLATQSEMLMDTHFQGFTLELLLKTDILLVNPWYGHNFHGHSSR